MFLYVFQVPLGTTDMLLHSLALLLFLTGVHEADSQSRHAGPWGRVGQ